MAEVCDDKSGLDGELCTGKSGLDEKSVSECDPLDMDKSPLKRKSGRDHLFQYSNLGITYERMLERFSGIYASKNLDSGELYNLTECCFQLLADLAQGQAPGSLSDDSRCVK